MKRYKRITESLLSWTLAVFLLTGYASAAPEDGADDGSVLQETTADAPLVTPDSTVQEHTPSDVPDTAESTGTGSPAENTETSENPGGENPDRGNPDGENADGGNPDEENPDGGNPGEENPDRENTDAEEAELQGLFGWKSRPSLTVSLDGWRAGQMPNQPVVTGNEEEAPVILVYRDSDGNIVPDIAAAPAGTYTVTAFLEESEDYTAASARADFSITPAYTVTWKNADGTVLETDRNVEPGTLPRYDGPEPRKERTAAYTYAFRGWDPAVTPDSTVNGDITYTAVFSFTLNEYAVDFLDDDGTVLKHAVYAYGTSASEIVRPAPPTKGLTGEYAYTFQNWTPEIADVTGAAAYTAVYQRSPVQIYHPAERTKSYYSTLVEPCTGGTIRALPPEARPGTPVLLSASAEEGYTLDTLIVRGLGRTETLGLTRVGENRSFVMPSFDVSVTAAFRKLEPAVDSGVNTVPAADTVPETDTVPAAETLPTADTTGGEKTAPANLEGTPSGRGSPNAAPETQNTQQNTQSQEKKQSQQSTQSQAAADITAQGADSHAKKQEMTEPYTLTRSSESTGFSDVSGSAYYGAAVKWAVEKNVLSGVTETVFAPGAPCTRAQMVLALWRASGSPRSAAGNGNPFSDVDVNSPCYEAVLWALETGVTRGTTSATFSPDRPVTRAQAVTLLYRLLGSRSKRANPFVDAAQGQYFYDAALWACEKGITRGTTASTFSPGTCCTRAQAAAFLYRAFV